MAETEVMAPKRRGSSPTFMGLEQALVLQPLLSDCRVLLILVEEDLNSPGITEISVFFAIVSQDFAVLQSHGDGGRLHLVCPFN